MRRNYDQLESPPSAPPPAARTPDAPTAPSGSGSTSGARAGMRWVVVAVAVGSMRCSRYEAMAGGGGRERLNSEAITEAIRPCTPQGAFGARHGHTRSTYARHRIRHGIRHTAARAGRRPRPRVPNDRLRHMRIYPAERRILIDDFFSTR